MTYLQLNYYLIVSHKNSVQTFKECHTYWVFCYDLSRLKHNNISQYNVQALQDWYSRNISRKRRLLSWLLAGENLSRCLTIQYELDWGTLFAYQDHCISYKPVYLGSRQSDVPYQLMVITVDWWSIKALQAYQATNMIKSKIPIMICWMHLDLSCSSTRGA